MNSVTAVYAVIANTWSIKTIKRECHRSVKPPHALILKSSALVNGLVGPRVWRENWRRHGADALLFNETGQLINAINCIP